MARYESSYGLDHVNSYVADVSLPSFYWMDYQEQLPTGNPVACPALSTLEAFSALYAELGADILSHQNSVIQENSASGVPPLIRSTSLVASSPCDNVDEFKMTPQAMVGAPWLSTNFALNDEPVQRIEPTVNGFGWDNIELTTASGRFKQTRTRRKWTNGTIKCNICEKRYKGT